MHELLPQSIGWYGKLPTRGDFVGRGLPRAWLRTWDGWLQRALAAAAQQMGAAALRERLNGMPPWQCLVLPQRQGDAAWCGVVVPSADRVGRVFPLLLAEAYAWPALGTVDLGELRARGQSLAQWLEAARPALSAERAPPALSPKDLEAGAAVWTRPPLTCPEPDDTRPGGDVSGLCLTAPPQTASLWWPAVAPHAEPRAQSLADTWPPSDALLLHWLGELPDGGDSVA